MPTLTPDRLRSIAITSMILAAGWAAYVITRHAGRPALILGAVPFLIVARIAARAAGKAAAARPGDHDVEDPAPGGREGGT